MASTDLRTINYLKFVMGPEILTEDKTSKPRNNMIAVTVVIL